MTGTLDFDAFSADQAPDAAAVDAADLASPEAPPGEAPPRPRSFRWELLVIVAAALALVLYPVGINFLVSSAAIVLALLSVFVRTVRDMR